MCNNNYCSVSSLLISDYVMIQYLTLRFRKRLVRVVLVLLRITSVSFRRTPCCVFKADPVVLLGNEEDVFMDV